MTLSVADWWFPSLSRRLAGRAPRRYPITVAQQLLTHELNGGLDRATGKLGLEVLADLAAWRPETDGCWAWGLGFPWASKNGTYPANTPFVTHTPTVMQALLAVAPHHEEAMTMFYGTRAFLDRLPIRSKSERELAVAYAPRDEPRIVVNAQSYAALGFALHARFGREHERESANSAVQPTAPVDPGRGRRPKAAGGTTTILSVATSLTACTPAWSLPISTRSPGSCLRFVQSWSPHSSARGAGSRRAF